MSDHTEIRFDSLNNSEALREELIGILKQFDKDLNHYQTDVYLYIDKETNTGEWYLFPNVGGNSWLNDDHITVYSDKCHYDDIFDYFNDEFYIAEVLGVTAGSLAAEVYETMDKDVFVIGDVGYEEIVDYIKKNDKYLNKLQEEYNRVIDEESEYDYAENADAIIRGIGE